MKYLYFIAIALLCSCSKKSDTQDQTSTIQGSITVYDKSGNENAKYDDISIKLIDAQNQVSTGTVDATGKYKFEKVMKGDVILTFNKPGYGYIDSIKFNHQKPNDTLSTVQLVEDIPFTYRNNGISYSGGWLNYPLSCDYHNTTDQYMATFFVCLSKYADVSITKANLIWREGSSVNVQYVSGYYGGKATFSFNNFTNAGFIAGDKIYGALVPVTQKYSALYAATINSNNQNINYQVISRKAGTTSNVSAFTLYP